jgi:PhnB protein
MAKRTLAQQLDEGVEILMSRPEGPVPELDPRVTALLTVAAGLRGLPDEKFRARLKEELTRREPMTTASVSVEPATPGRPIREGFHTVTPYLTVTAVADLIDFIQHAFGGVELFRSTGSAGGVHAEVRVGDSMLMIGGGESWPGTTAAIHFYVPDADAVYRQALEAGAVSLSEPVDQFYGDREAAVRDLAGNHWYIATNKATGGAPAGLRSLTPYLIGRGTERLIDFLQRAFGAEEKGLHRGPDGSVMHAEVQVGDSMVEMGEAHGPWPAMPATLFLYVEDVDALYRRAVAAGAVSIAEPSDQPYGRTAGVKDPSENTWYLATHTGSGGGQP